MSNHKWIELRSKAELPEGKTLCWVKVDKIAKPLLAQYITNGYFDIKISESSLYSWTMISHYIIIEIPELP